MSAMRFENLSPNPVPYFEQWVGVLAQEPFPLLLVPPVGQSVLLVPFGSPARTLSVRVLAQEGRNELRSATLGVTVVGEDKWLQ